MSYPQFEELKVWQKAKDLATDTHNAFACCPFESVRDQMQRSSIYLMNNIAKGVERKGSNEFDKFLYVARGYCGELKSTLYLAQELECISGEEREQLNESCITVSKMLAGLIKKIHEPRDSNNDTASHSSAASKPEEKAETK